MLLQGIKRIMRSEVGFFLVEMPTEVFVLVTDAPFEILELAVSALGRKISLRNLVRLREDQALGILKFLLLSVNNFKVPEHYTRFAFLLRCWARLENRPFSGMSVL